MEKEIIKAQNNVRYLLVLDFEATCDNNNDDPKTGGRSKPRFHPQEILEFPTVIVNIVSKQCEGEFATYIKPIYNPKLAQFCINLTGITQDQVDSAPEFKDALQKYDTWLHSQGFLIDGKVNPEKLFVFVTCGDWDLGKMLPLQCSTYGIALPSYFL